MERALLATLLLLVLAAPAGAARDSAVYEVGREEYREIRDLSLDILQRYPPHRFFYVAIGGSPTPVMAFLESLLPGSTRTVPFSGFHDLDRALRPDEEHRLLQHLRRFLPSTRRLGSRTVLVIDYSCTGRSISAATRHIGRAYLEAGASPTVRPVTLGAELSEEGVTGPDGGTMDNVTIAGYQLLARKLYAARYKDVARLPRFRPPFEQALKEVARARPFYLKFRENVRSHMRRDPELLRELGLINRPLLEAARAHPLARQHLPR